MHGTRLYYSERFSKSFLALTQAEQTQVRSALKLFLTDPRHPSLRVRKLNGQSIWYLRASRELRITLQPSECDWILRNVGHHDPVLRNP